MSTNNKTAAAISYGNADRKNKPQGIVLARKSTATDAAPAKVRRKYRTREYKLGEHWNSVFNQELADSIVQRLETRSLMKICAEDGDVPDRETINRWMRLNETFASACARARSEHAQYRLERIAEDMDNITPETARAVQVKSEFARWNAEKLLSRVYGNKLQVDVDLSVKRVVTDI